jgi:predicted signal transduction protein with EAL and GGDEF domain
VARMGGDSFNLLLPNIGSEKSAAKVAQKILDSLKIPFDLGERDIFVAASIGVALYPYDGQGASTLLKNADIALQRAKEKGRNSHHFFDQAMNARAENQMALELQLRSAIEGNEFSLYFQPQIDSLSGRVIGAEALIRWQHPMMGLMMPDLFIPLAEQTGLISPIGEWVLHTACAQASAWQGSGQPPLRIAVNLSPRQFQRADIYRKVDRVLKETGLPPECLSLEVTESAVMQDVDHAIETLVRLKNLGVHLAIDDFGTGYSSLSYLKRFPIDLLKIDRSFIMDIPNVPDDIAIVSAVIAMAHQLNIKVLAEGVQSMEQRDILLSHHCDELQGYHFAQPLPADDFLLWRANA